MEVKMEADEMSISSEFSIIPESMVQALEEITDPISMNASFFKNEEATAAPSGSSAPFFNTVKFGTMQRIKDHTNGSLGSFVVIFSCDPDFTMTKTDRIAMYSVGFTSAKDYHCFIWVPVPNAKLDSLTDSSMSSKSAPITVKFAGSNLPVGMDEFYQVCYLMHDGQIAGISVPFQLKMTEMTENEEIENTARKVLSIRVQGLVQEQKDLRESIQDLEIVCNNLKSENEELTDNLKEAYNELHIFKDHSEDLEVEVSKLQSELEEVNPGILERDQQIQDFQSLIAELQSKLTDLVLEMNSLKEKLEVAEEERSVSEERKKVIMQDNIELKTCLQYIKEDLDQALKEKEAAEKIASDLSHRLQSALDEHEILTKDNMKLSWKLKELQIENCIDESLKSAGWHCVPNERQYDVNEESDEVETNPQSSRKEKHESAMTESVAPSVLTSFYHSNCSQNTKELTEAFNQKMETIVAQLYQQKEQINGLKVAIEKNRLQSQSESSVSQITTDEIVGELKSSNNDTLDAVEVTSDTSLSDTQKEEKMFKDVRLNAPDDDKKVLYGNSFLPTLCTAPVFLPPSNIVQPPRSCLPSAPSPTLSLRVNEDYSIIRADESQNYSIPSTSIIPSPTILDNQSQIQFPQHSVVATTSANILPPPLLPETTATARNAAVLKQFINENVISCSNDEENAEDHFQDAYDIRETILDQDQLAMLTCPMCQLAFDRNGIHLLQDHITSHLEKICPVCSNAFPRSTKQEEFEVHVHSHFNDEDEQTSFDPSGPWSQQRDTGWTFPLFGSD